MVFIWVVLLVVFFVCLFVCLLLVCFFYFLGGRGIPDNDPAEHKKNGKDGLCCERMWAGGSICALEKKKKNDFEAPRNTCPI